jgi:WD40 repeat protein
VSGSAGGNNIKKWKCPEGAFVFNFSGHNAIINTLSVNAEGVFFSGGAYSTLCCPTDLTHNLAADNGSLSFWDYNTGTSFQNMEDVPQPGSLEAEAGVFCSTFDMTGTRLITGGADKTIKVRRLADRSFLEIDTGPRSMPSSPSSRVNYHCNFSRDRLRSSYCHCRCVVLVLRLEK